VDLPSGQPNTQPVHLLALWSQCLRQRQSLVDPRCKVLNPVSTNVRLFPNFGPSASQVRYGGCQAFPSTSPALVPVSNRDRCPIVVRVHSRGTSFSPAGKQKLRLSTSFSLRSGPGVFDSVSLVDPRGAFPGGQPNTRWCIPALVPVSLTASRS
jgi:hypothetical protein